MNAFAKMAVVRSDRTSPMYDPNRKKYSTTKYNCSHFAEAVDLQGNPKVDRPLVLIPTPNNMADKYIEEGNADVTYNPETGELKTAKRDESDAKLP